MQPVQETSETASSPVAAPRRLAVLGATGSIGTQTLDIVRLFPDRLSVQVLTARRNAARLLQQALEFRPACVVIDDPEGYRQLREALAGTGIEVLQGEEGRCACVQRPDVDVVVAALVGFAGLRPVLAALEAGKQVALANKETLVAGGALVREALRRHGGTLIPVDSEHSAIFQCLVGEEPASVETLILTASGGPFRTRPLETFDHITPDEALCHPNWSMGAKVTVDSATMMNKGLEVIEAHWLFELPAERIQVLVHPQSIIHSMVTFVDGSTKAQLGVPDMRLPIQYALSYPERWEAPHERIDWVQLGRLDFEAPDPERFPCLSLAYEALRRGGTAPAVLNAANEQAVQLFLQEQIRFTDIARLVEAALEHLSEPEPVPSYEHLQEADRRARHYVQELAGVAAH